MKLRTLAVVVLVTGIAAGGGVGFTSSAFSSGATNGGNSFQAAATFCATQTIAADADTYTHNGNKTTNYGTQTTIFVRSGAEIARSYVRFTLPARGSCTLTSATLRLYGSSGSTDGSTRTLQAYRAAASWGELTLTWNNQPGLAGTATTFTVAPNFNGWASWDATAHVNAMYSGAESSFVIKDSSETGGSQRWYTGFNSRENSTNRPQLVLGFS